jgi:hypothetical protein
MPEYTTPHEWFAHVVETDAKGKKYVYDAHVTEATRDFAVYRQRFNEAAVRIEWTPIDAVPNGKPIGITRVVEFSGPRQVKSRTPDDDEWQRGRQGPDPAEEPPAPPAAPAASAVPRPAPLPAAKP